MKSRSFRTCSSSRPCALEPRLGCKLTLRHATSVASPTAARDNVTTVSWSSGSGSSQRKVLRAGSAGRSRGTPRKVKQVAVGWLHGQSVVAPDAEVEHNLGCRVPMRPPPPLSQLGWLGQAPEDALTRRVDSAFQFQDQSARLTVHGPTLPPGAVRHRSAAHRPDQRVSGPRRQAAEVQLPCPSPVKGERRSQRRHPATFADARPRRLGDPCVRRRGSTVLGQVWRDLPAPPQGLSRRGRRGEDRVGHGSRRDGGERQLGAAQVAAAVASPGAL